MFRNTVVKPDIINVTGIGSATNRRFNFDSQSQSDNGRKPSFRDKVGTFFRKMGEVLEKVGPYFLATLATLPQIFNSVARAQEAFNRSRPKKEDKRRRGWEYTVCVG